MSLYQKLNHGRYKKDGRFISKDDVPEHVIRILEHQEELEFGNVYFEPRKCMFCGQFALQTRMVNLQTVYLCDQDYYDKTIGEVAQYIREANAKVKENV